MILLADLSNNNPEPINWRAMRRDGVYGVLLKVTEGTSFIDRTWRERSAAARQAGLRVGGYHFAHVNLDPLVQAKLFSETLGKVQRRDLHPALDLEQESLQGARHDPAYIRQWAQSFQRRVHALAGVRALFYTNPGLLSELRWPEPLGTGAGLWVADYGPDDGHDHGVQHPIRPWRAWVAHQYTSKGRCTGVTGDVDLSHARSRRKVLAHGLRGLP